MSFDLGTLDWTAISAIGTILAAFATVWAVIVALNVNKPRVEVKNMLNMVNSKQGFVSTSVNRITSNEPVWLIVATNTGRVPVTIKLMGYRAGKTHMIINPDPGMFGNLPAKLEASEDFTVWTKMPKEKLFIFNAYELSFAVDSYGNYHYVKINLLKALIRRVWWKFGKKYNT